MLISQQKLAVKLHDLNIFSRTDPKIIHKYIPKRHKYWVGSGREALKQILLKTDGGRIGIPAFTCHVVLDAIKRSKKTPVFYNSSVVSEVDEIERIIKQIDVLIISYNFGFLPKVDEIIRLCKDNNVIIIEDCAQALGATYNGKLVGSFGDYAFYSFGISKNIGFCGGLIASDRELDLKISKKYPGIKLIGILIKALTSFFFFNNKVYPITRKLLGKELNKKQEPLGFNCPRFVNKIVLNQFKRYDEILKLRRKNAEYCLKELGEVIDFVKPSEDSNLAWLYFTILIENREKLINKLLKENVELGVMRTFKSLDSSSEKACEAEKKHLTFALYRDFKEIKYIVDKIKETCRNGK